MLLCKRWGECGVWFEQETCIALSKFLSKDKVLLPHKFLVLPRKNDLVKQVCDCKKKFLTSKFYP